MMNNFPQPGGELPHSHLPEGLPLPSNVPPLPKLPSCFPSTVPCNAAFHPGCKIISLAALQRRAHAWMQAGEVVKASGLIRDVARALSYPHEPAVIERVIPLECQCANCQAKRAAKEHHQGPGADCQRDHGRARAAG